MSTHRKIAGVDLFWKRSGFRHESGKSVHYELFICRACLGDIEVIITDDEETNVKAALTEHVESHPVAERGARQGLRAV